MKHERRFTFQNVRLRLKVIAAQVYRRYQPLPPFDYLPLAEPGDPAPLGASGEWEKLRPPTYWSAWREEFFLRTSFSVPEGWRGPLALVLPLENPRDFNHPEAMVYLDGERLAACDRQHHELRLPESVGTGRDYKLELRGWTGIGHWLHNTPGSRPLLPVCALVELDEPTQALLDTARLALHMAEALGPNDPARGGLLNALVEHLKKLDTREPVSEAFYDDVPAVLASLKEAIGACGAPLEVDLVAVGHAHIDVAWLWPLAQTRRKAARSFANALSLMRQHPGFHFSQSQPQLYRYIEEDEPTMFAEIKERVLEGRWEVLGTAWVEMDCNLTGAESLVRQFLLGRRYFQTHFGGATPVLWLPDCFGFPASLPQLIRGAGLEGFVTSKLSWNQYNKFPYDSFRWRGLDGTEVLSHFITTPELSEMVGAKATYNGDLSPQQVLGTWREYQQKAENRTLLTAYGYGDGGGGPTREMAAAAEELASYPSAPRVKMGTVKTFMERLAKSADALPAWAGELYLEYHRGTYTSQALTKRLNREAEGALHEAEFLAAYASLFGDAYPKDALDKAWETLLLQQFHDILPGSSIGEVYRDSEEDFGRVFALVEEVRLGAFRGLAKHLGGDVVAVNSTPFGGLRLGKLVGRLEPAQSLSLEGRTLPTQTVADGTLVLLNLAPYSLQGLQLREKTSPAPEPEQPARVRLEGGGATLENAYVRARFDKNGELTSLYDKAAEREMLAGPGNRLQVFEDRAYPFDAWDVEPYYDDRAWFFEPATIFRVSEEGPLRATLELERPYRESSLSQRVSLSFCSARLDFETVVDWREEHQLLKVAFPVDILSSAASYHVQWGVVERPTHANTSWDWARFEAPAHHWADLSGGESGVSLLSNCKYGYDVHGNTLRLTLIKSAAHPDPHADRGEHRFTYSLLSHKGDWRGATQREGYWLNAPLRLEPLGGTGTELELSPLVSCEAAGVIVETVKAAEDGRGWVVRLFESRGSHVRGALRCGFALQEAWRCTLLEDDEARLEPLKNELALDLRPYQILTLRLLGGF